MGLEALSRGAKRVSFVESNPRHIILLKKNLSLWPSEAQVRLFGISATEFLKQEKGAYDIIFLDPPYQTQEAEKILPSLKQGDIIRPHGRVIFEHFHKRILPNDIGALHLMKRSQYGDTVLSIYGQS